jgi:8-hydroxy-5-deazaflavin:NADPH oxidoreductase
MLETAVPKGVTLTPAIIGVGNFGSALARHLVAGHETVVLATRDKAQAPALARELGSHAAAASVEDAIAGADVVVLALWLDQLTQLLPAQVSLLENKVVVDLTEPLGFDEHGQMLRALPDDESAGSAVSGPLLASSANREPHRVALFYAADDDIVAAAVERLIRAAGFDPVKAGGIDAALRIEMPGGDLHQMGLNGELLDLERAREVLATTEVTA